MESVPATRTVRRTVRVAVALVVGQALLYALIGYLTLGRSSGSGDRLADPPLALPPATTSIPAAPSPFASATSLPATATHRSRDATTRVTAAPDPAATTTASAEPAPDTLGAVVPTADSSTAPPPEPALIPPPATTAPTTSPTTSPPPAVVQEPVVVGDPCAPEWAFGRTADGTLVLCARVRHHGLRWKIV